MISKITVFLFGAIFGSVITYFTFIFIIGGQSVDFVQSQFKHYHSVSEDFFKNFSPQSSELSQYYFLIFSVDAWNRGLIDDSQFYEAAALGNIRMCINFEEIGELEKADRHCEIAKQHVTKWGDVNFSELKTKQIKLKKESKKESVSTIDMQSH